MKNTAKKFDFDGGDFSGFCEGLRLRFGPAAYKSWMCDLQLASNTARDVTLSTQSPIRRDTLIQRFKPGMREEWIRRVGPVDRFSIVLRSGAANGPDHNETPSSLSEAYPQNSSAATSGAFSGPAPAGLLGGRETGRGARAPSLEDLVSPLDARCTFENFAVDDSNRLAKAAARQVFADAATSNLIYIYGPSGVGKTHLLHAVGHEWRRRHGAGGCAYITQSNLSAGCVDAVFSNSIPSLHKDLLSQQLLLIDDIHLLKRKKRTQQEVLNMVNAFVSSGRQLVIAGEAAPVRLAEKGLHARLADRLSGGLPVPVERGGANLHTKILASRIAQAATKCEIGNDVVEYIVANFSSSTREAIGALNQILLAYSDEAVHVGLAEAERVLGPRLADRKKQIGTLEDAIEAAADAFSITVADIQGRSQPQRIVKARHAYVYVAREHLRESFPRIAAAIGRDHTTAISSHRRAQALLERNEDFACAVTKIKVAVGA